MWYYCSEMMRGSLFTEITSRLEQNIKQVACACWLFILLALPSQLRSQKLGCSPCLKGKGWIFAKRMDGHSARHLRQCVNSLVSCLGCLKSHFCGSWASTSALQKTWETENKLYTEKVVAQHVAKACCQRLTNTCEVSMAVSYVELSLGVCLGTSGSASKLRAEGMMHWESLRIIEMPYEIWTNMCACLIIYQTFASWPKDVSLMYLTFVPSVWEVRQLLAVAVCAAFWRFCRFCSAEY